MNGRLERNPAFRSAITIFGLNLFFRGPGNHFRGSIKDTQTGHNTGTQSVKVDCRPSPFLSLFLAPKVDPNLGSPVLIVGTLVVVSKRWIQRSGCLDRRDSVGIVAGWLETRLMRELKLVVLCARSCCSCTLVAVAMKHVPLAVNEAEEWLSLPPPHSLGRVTAGVYKHPLRG